MIKEIKKYKVVCDICDLTKSINNPDLLPVGWSQVAIGTQFNPLILGIVCSKNCHRERLLEEVERLIDNREIPHLDKAL